MHLPVGTSNFKKLVECKSLISGEGYLFVDKSEPIRAILDDLTEVVTLTRPRRFGKTLNLSMLHHFFVANVHDRSTKDLFAGLKIASDPICMKEQGQYPVIFISFKDAKYNTYDLSAIILIDEYDTPIQEAYLNAYYDQLMSFMLSG